eukprot:9201443-Alexandrium_andersonii.AAC.1
MLRRIDGFEALLRQHSEGAGAARARATSAEPETPAAKRPAVCEESPVDTHIKRLRHRAQLPQQRFLEQLESYQEIDSGTWAESFPPGYRERISASFLTEAYST